jgi:drug/metabolite transporter (DMT)-like permease
MGEIFALAAAVVWAFAVILFKRSGETVPPFSLNLFRASVSLLVFTALLFLSGEGIYDQASGADTFWLFASGVLGITLADTFFHRGLNMMGAGISAIVGCLYSPFIVLFAYLLLDERLGPWQLLGMVLVIGGVLMATRHRPPPGASARTLAFGVFWGVLAMASQGLGIVIAKPALERSPILWATVLRLVAAQATLLPLALLSSERRAIFAVFRPVRSWRFTLTGTLLGSCLALLFWIAGMKYAKAGTAAILNQTSTIYVLAFASLFLREPFTRRKGLATLLALAGIALVLFG